MCAHITAKSKNGAEVNLQNTVPVRRRELVCWVPGLNAGAIKKNVDGVAVFENLRDELRDRFLRREIACVNLRSAAERLDG